MAITLDPNSVRDTAFDWTLHLVLTDAPENWASLVEQIAELEALLCDLDNEVDAFGASAAEQIRAALQRKHCLLRDLDVG